MRRKEIPPCTRVCAVSGRSLEDGEKIMVVLVPSQSPDQEWNRLDFEIQNFSTAPEGAVAWWVSQVPESAPVVEEQDPLLELLLDVGASAEARWDAVERLARKRRVVVERPSSSEVKKGSEELGQWHVRIVATQERFALPNPPSSTSYGKAGSGGLLAGISKVAVLVLALGSWSTGCATLKQSLNKENKPEPVVSETPTAAQMVEYLNDNARRMQAIQCNSVAIDCKQGSQNAPGLDGMVVLQKPNNFRLKAKVLGQNAVDLGSNQEEFWYWISKADPPYVFHCSHAAMAAGQVRMPFPFQPEMILAAMGIAEYDPNKRYEVRSNGQVAELRETVVSPQGKSVTRVTVFLKAQAQPGKPQVLAHSLLDENGKEICTVQVQEVQVLKQSGAILPQKVRFHWPDQQVEMVMRFGEFQNTDISPDRAAALFSRRDLGNMPGFDLARWAPDQPAPATRGQFP